METLTLPQTITRAKPTGEEAINWRKLALAQDRILYAMFQNEEPDKKDLLEAKRLRAQLELP